MTARSISVKYVLPQGRQTPQKIKPNAWKIREANQAMPNDFHNISKTFDVVYDTLRNRIMTPELPPATKLNRRELEAEFGVSQTPIRDAMTRLSDEHLIDIFRQSKTMVARINLEELHTVFLLRNAMKNDLAERLAQGVSPADFECAHHIVRIQQLGLSANETLETFVEQQDMFVKSLYQTTGLVNVYLCWAF